MRAIFTAIGILCVLGVLWWILFRGASAQRREHAIGSSPATRGMRAAAEGEHLGTKEQDTAAADRGRAVQVRNPVATDAIAGVVVDDAGNPVANAKIGYEPVSTGPRGHTIHSGKDGTFRVQRQDQSTMDPVVVTASRDAYESGKTETRHAWGSTDAKVVLKRGLDLEVVVRDGDRDVPLERYGVRCVAQGAGGLRNDRGKLREQGAHPGGILRLTGVLRGRHLLIVEPEGTEWQPSQPRIFEVTDQGAPRQDITVWRPINKTVRVTTTAGAPVAFTHVDLVRKIGEAPVDAFTQTSPIANILSSHPESVGAQLMSKGNTARDGTVELSAPPHETLFLRALGTSLGPGHAPVVREVTIDPTGGDLEIVVPKGGVLVGTIHPPELVRQLAAEAATVHLWKADGRRAGGGHEEFPLDSSTVGLGEDGTFRLEGIPPGNWDVLLRYYEWSVAERSRSRHGGWHRIGRVYLAEDDERSETFDLSWLLKAEIEGVVTLDGKPIPDAKVWLLADGSDQGDRGSSMADKPGIAVEPDGRFKTTVWPATYRMVLSGSEIAGQRRQIYDSEVVRAEPGQKIKRTFDLRSTVLKLRLLGSDGVTPAAQVRFVVKFPDAGWPVRPEPTDEQGRAEIYGLPAGEVTVQVWPKRLSTDEARMEFYRTLKNKADDVLVNVGTATVASPETSKTIILPASTEY